MQKDSHFAEERTQMSSKHAFIGIKEMQNNGTVGYHSHIHYMRSITIFYKYFGKQKLDMCTS